MTRIAGQRRHGRRWNCLPSKCFRSCRSAASTTSCCPWSPRRTSTVVGGATQTVRDLVAAWEQKRRDGARGRRRRRVAFASGRSDPRRPARGTGGPRADGTEVPYYSATLCDPRDRPSCDADYWADNLRHTVRFAAAVQAALEDGYRVFGELVAASAADPRRRAERQQPRHADRRAGRACGASRSCRSGCAASSPICTVRAPRWTSPCSTPDGRLVDAPLPTWTHRELMLSRDTAGSPAARRLASLAVHPLLGAHVRLMEEPERHVWQGEVGTAAQPWLGDHQIHSVAALPGAAYCEMALAAARTVLGEASEVRDIRFEQTLLLDDETLASAVGVGGGARRRSTSRSRPTRTASGSRRASAVLHDAAGLAAAARARHRRADSPSHPSRLDGAELRKAFDSVGIQYGPAFAGLAAVHIARRRRHHGARRGRAARPHPLAAGGVRVTRRCWMPASSRSSSIPTSRPQARAVCCCRWACAGCGATARPATPTTASPG